LSRWRLTGRSMELMIEREKLRRRGLRLRTEKNDKELEVRLLFLQERRESIGRRGQKSVCFEESAWLQRLRMDPAVQRPKN